MFFWCHFRHINPVRIHPERISWEDEKLVNNVNYNGVGFPVQNKDFSKIEKKKNICINVFCSENKLVFSIYVSDQKLETSVDLLLVADGNISHYVSVHQRFWQIYVSQIKE